MQYPAIRIAPVPIARVRQMLHQNNPNASKPMTTVLHVIDSDEPGGAETVFAQLADGMREKGFRSVAVVSGYGWPKQELERRGIDPIVLEVKGTFNLRLLWKLARITWRNRVDIIHSHLLGSNVYCAMVGLLTRRPVIATFHGMIDVSPGERFRRLKFWIMNLGVDRFVTVSQRLMEVIRDEGLLDPKRTTIIYNGADTRRYGKSSTKSELVSRLGIGEPCKLIGSLGNMHPAKGYDDLVAAVPLVLQRYPDVHFVIAGQLREDIVEQLEASMAELGVSGRVHFIGFIDDTARFLSQLDVFLLTSKSEGFSIAMIEALATALPVVATRCGGPEEIAKDSDAALLVDVGSPSQIAEAVISVLESEALSSKLSTLGPSLVAERFSYAAMLDAYSRLYAYVQRR